jgi:hypothetical protein
MHTPAPDCPVQELRNDRDLTYGEIFADAAKTCYPERPDQHGTLAEMLELHYLRHGWSKLPDRVQDYLQDRVADDDQLQLFT